MVSPAGLTPGTRAPSAAFSRPGGGTVTTEGLLAEANGLPLLLAFFKTSCPTCRLAWPYLQRLHEAYGGTGVRVVGVSQNGAAESEDFFETFGKATFDLVLDPEPRFAASNAFQVESVPHFVLISPAGLIEEIFSGWSKAKMEALGERLAAGRSLARIPVVPPGDLVRDFQSG
ncbi:MAG TPA: TlpA disulfide reductase family protein [Thermoanaerobaculia bacterium]|nr:TlpA disulfide reductase family protein [Thermoanaerobaculia bacterium]